MTIAHYREWYRQIHGVLCPLSDRELLIRLNLSLKRQSLKPADLGALK